MPHRGRMAEAPLRRPQPVAGLHLPMAVARRLQQEPLLAAAGAVVAVAERRVAAAEKAAEAAVT